MKFFFVGLLIVALFVFTTAHESQAQSMKKSTIKLILGSVLVVAGVWLAVDGFSKEEHKTDISNPKLDMSNWYWTKEQISSWWADGYGTVKNTGNVELNDVKIYITYYNSYGGIIATDYCYLNVYWLDPLPEGATDSWYEMTHCGITEPYTASIKASYTYTKKYTIETEMKNPTMGYIGIGTVGVGAYFLSSYYKDTLHEKYRQSSFKIESVVRNNYTGIQVSKVF